MAFDVPPADTERVALSGTLSRGHALGLLGAVGATTLWLVGSALFALYASNLGSYDQTYGSLGGVVVLMLWLYLTALAIILGAELNAELEAQTEHDTTIGTPKPVGQRDAVVADTVASP
jgi:membrane protein